MTLQLFVGNRYKLFRFMWNKLVNLDERFALYISKLDFYIAALDTTKWQYCCFVSVMETLFNNKDLITSWELSHTEDGIIRSEEGKHRIHRKNTVVKAFCEDLNKSRLCGNFLSQTLCALASVSLQTSMSVNVIMFAVNKINSHDIKTLIYYTRSILLIYIPW